MPRGEHQGGHASGILSQRNMSAMARPTRQGGAAGADTEVTTQQTERRGARGLGCREGIGEGLARKGGVKGRGRRCVPKGADAQGGAWQVP